MVEVEGDAAATMRQDHNMYIYALAAVLWPGMTHSERADAEWARRGNPTPPGVFHANAALRGSMVCCWLHVEAILQLPASRSSGIRQFTGSTRRHGLLVAAPSVF